ncbi:MAG: lactonase family protein [Dongiaceae bacterium]
MIAYVASAGTREIIGFALDRERGGLSRLFVVGVPGGTGESPTSMPLALGPDRRRLYAAVRCSPFVLASFAIDRSSGALAPLATAPLPDAMAYVATDRTGRWLLAASYVGACLSLSAAEGDGAVRDAARQVIGTPPKAHCILADPGNRWVLATSLGGDVVLVFRLDAATGALKAHPPGTLRLPPGSGPRHLAFHPEAALVFLLDELGGRVRVLAFDAEAGRLEPRHDVPLLARGAPESHAAAEIRVTPDGRFLYASERVTSRIAGFAVDCKAGRLTPLGSWPTEPSPRSFAISPCGRWLLAAGQESGRLASYAIDRASGALAECAVVRAGTNPSWIEIIELSPEP